MNPSVISETPYLATQSTIATAVPFADFEARFEKAVPQVMGIVSVLAAHLMPWEEVVSMTTDAAPNGFLIYLDAPVDRIMRIAGHSRRTCSYLIGNHVDAERMYRHNPAVMLHSPLRVVLWEELTCALPASSLSLIVEQLRHSVRADCAVRKCSMCRKLHSYGQG